MPVKTMTVVSSLLILPAVIVFFYVLRVSTQGLPIDRWLPEWHTIAVIGSLALLERLYHYRYAVSQRPVLARDIASTLVNMYLTGAVAGFVVLPVLMALLAHVFGRKLLFASPGQLGPIWFQVPLILLAVSLFRYWMHRFQHSNEFLWRLHSYHHSVTDLKASNLLVSHPLDFALRNILVFLLLRVVGFEPLSIVLAVPALNVVAAYSHCGGDVKGGILNYVFVTPEVHRWHHSAIVPEGHKYSVNYGVEYAFWDILFGTYYLPQKDGVTEQPVRLGHPSGFADEGNYVRLLLAPFGLYRPLSWFKRRLGMPQGPQQPAE